MAITTDILQFIKDLFTRIDRLEKSNQVKNLTIPAGGKLVVDTESADPPVEDGRIYYNSSTTKLRKCTNGAWSDVG
jgi:hypothetical protein